MSSNVDNIKPKRSGFKVMLGLIGMVKPLAGYMVLAIIMGIIGFLTAIFITVFGAVAILDVLGVNTGISLGVVFACVIVFALVRGILRYAEQSCNHFIAFKLLALIRDKVFFALRKLCPAKLEGRDKGDLISVITSDIDVCREICGDLNNVSRIKNEIDNVDLKRVYEALMRGRPYKKQGKFNYANTVKNEEKLITMRLL